MVLRNINAAAAVIIRNDAPKTPRTGDSQVGPKAVPGVIHGKRRINISHLKNSNAVQIVAAINTFRTGDFICFDIILKNRQKSATNRAKMA
jgi:hypothetical protein